ncbi:MAG: hypothetical protein ABJA79_10130, partial [Parafilimonas sp.]
MKKAFLIFIVTVTTVNLYAQKENPHDSTFYTTYINTNMARIYISKKYANFKIQGTSNDLDYRANTKLNLGVGFTY